MATLPHEGTYSVINGHLAVPVGSGYRNAYLARPDQAGSWPVVLIVPDLNGLGAHEKYLAGRLARRGLAVLALELHVSTPVSHDAALDAYHSLSDHSALHVLDEAHDFLRSTDIDWAHTDRVGLIGLDVGGRLALIASAHRPWVGATAVAYTPLTGDEDRTFQVADMLNHLANPTLGLYGDSDDLIDVETVDEAQTRNVTGQWLLYEGAKHGFLDEVGPNFDAAAFEDAVMRLTAFFQANLPAPITLTLG